MLIKKRTIERAEDRGDLAVEGHSSSKTAIRSKTEEVTCSGATSATSSSLVPAGAIIIGVSGIVTTTITGATTFDVGDGSDQDLYGNDIALTKGTTFDLADSNGTLPIVKPAASGVTLTANGSNFTAGAVRVVVHYIELAPPAG